VVANSFAVQSGVSALVGQAPQLLWFAVAGTITLAAVVRRGRPAGGRRRAPRGAAAGPGGRHARERRGRRERPEGFLMAQREDGTEPSRPVEGRAVPGRPDPVWERLEDQLAWYERKSGDNQRRYTRLKLLELALAAALPWWPACEARSG
jgi:hypothetical protein